MAAAEIVKACLESGSEAAWTAFVQRFQPVIAASVARVVRRYQSSNSPLIDDLVQETYLRICKDNCRCLREFKPRHDEAIFGYIKVIATSVALDCFRARGTQKRRGEVAEDETILEASAPSARIEESALIGQLEARLAASHTPRECSIFWLHYRQGYSARDIAAMPHFELGQKGVESCLHRLTVALRGVIGGSAGKGPRVGKGNLQQTTLGEME